MGLYERAEAQLLTILELEPRDAFYHFQLADLYRLMNRDEDSPSPCWSAPPNWRRATSITGCDWARPACGPTKPQSAVTHFEKAAQMAPTNASYQTLLLFAYMRNQQEPAIALEVEKVELDAYDEDFVNRIQRLAQPA